MSEDRMKRFDEIKLAALNCTACPLAATRTQVVFSRGDPRARLWIIGEGPGADEDATGTPFVGRAGQLLDKILVAAKIGQNEVFITNTVFCRPPGNRVPTNEEITACSVHRDALLDLWKPPIVVLLGATAARVFLGTDRLADLRGQRVERDGRAYFPTFHPAYLLRDPRQKGPAWKDWQLIRDALRGLPPDGGGAPVDPSDEALVASRSLMPYLEQPVMTPEGTGRLVQVFLGRAAVVLDVKPSKVTYFPTEVLAELLTRRRAG